MWPKGIRRINLAGDIFVATNDLRGVALIWSD